MSSPLPHFETARDLLPARIYDDDPKLVLTYWKAWELAFRHFHQPSPGSKFISQFIDAGGISTTESILPGTTEQEFPPGQHYPGRRPG